MSLPALAIAAQAVEVCIWPGEDDDGYAGEGWGLDLLDPDLNPTLDVRWVAYRSEGAGVLWRVASVDHDLSPA